VKTSNAHACAETWPGSRTIVLHAASKTYNIPGLACAYAVIPDEALRDRFKEAAK
jgi:cysteine-S-conjugate beta-lyase